MHTNVSSKTGCIFEGDCRTLNSFWHDGCSVYQCMQTPGSVTYQKLTDGQQQCP